MNHYVLTIRIGSSHFNMGHTEAKNYEQATRHFGCALVLYGIEVELLPPCPSTSALQIKGRKECFYVERINNIDSRAAFKHATWFKKAHLTVLTTTLMFLAAFSGLSSFPANAQERVVKFQPFLGSGVSIPSNGAANNAATTAGMAVI